MGSISSLNARTTGLMRSDQLLSQLQQTRQQLFEKQQDISTGQRYQSPSEAPGKTASILHLKQQVSARQQYQRNLEHAGGVLSTADQAMGDAADVLREAKSIASSQIGVGSDTGTREAEAEVIDSQLKSLMRIANRQHNDLPVFGGDSGSGKDDRVFESFLGGIRYTGGEENLKTQIDSALDEAFNTNGVDAFGALSARVESEVDLQPQATADTAIEHVDGAQGRGVRLGAIELTVDGTSATVDLSDADTLGDVTTRVNEAIDGIDSTAGSLSINGTGYQLTANGGHTISLSDIEDGQAAADLGVDISATGSTTNGAGVGPQLTESTKITSLGASMDLASGLKITQGQQTKTINFTGDTTIQDMQNKVEGLDLGLRLQINDEKNGLNLVSDVSGLELTVGENGGTTGRDLGLLTFGKQTRLENFRNGKGVTRDEGENDLAISLHDGTSFNVNLDGAATVQDAIDKIESAANSAGVAVGSDFSVELASNGAGLTVEDTTTPTGSDFSIQNANESFAATQLGIEANAGASNTIDGENTAPVRAENLFTHMMDLRQALRDDDTDGITFAGENLETDLSKVIEARGAVSTQAKQIEQAKTRSEDREVAEKTMLSKIEDTNMTEAITQFMQLQQQMQASLRVSGQNMQTSLLDFLR
jgi:flagellar hook-associated protein 3 FlgL